MKKTDEQKTPRKVSTCSKCGKPVMSNQSRHNGDHSICGELAERMKSDKVKPNYSFIGARAET